MENEAMVFTIFGILFFLVLTLVTIGFAMTKPKEEEAPEDVQTKIHTSGIYSIVRESPRTHIYNEKPSKEELIQYLSKKNESYNIDKLIKSWEDSLERSIKTVEDGDEAGDSFYFYKVPPEDPVCSRYIENGSYVTREEISENYKLLPPFHIGCKCSIVTNRDIDENLSDTAITGMEPFIAKDGSVSLPDWKILK